jgi:hypothetical protein
VKVGRPLSPFSVRFIFRLDMLGKLSYKNHASGHGGALARRGSMRSGGGGFGQAASRTAMVGGGSSRSASSARQRLNKRAECDPPGSTRSRPQTPRAGRRWSPPAANSLHHHTPGPSARGHRRSAPPSMRGRRHRPTPTPNRQRRSGAAPSFPAIRVAGREGNPDFLSVSEPSQSLDLPGASRRLG